MKERIIYERECGGCGTIDRTQAKIGFLGIIKKPKFPEGWQEGFDVNLCPTCLKNFHNRFLKEAGKPNK